jgi:hypothetical protein
MIPRLLIKQSAIGVWILVLALFVAISIAFAAPPTVTPSQPAASTASATIASSTEAPFTSGLAPLPNDQRVSAPMLPPGAFDPDTGPSDVIFPPQQITLRFNHKFHLQTQGLKCKNCHAGSETSTSANDRLIPDGKVCDSCHATDHSNLDKVEAGDGDAGKCVFCHVGYKTGDGNKVAALAMPRANLLFNHKAHVSKNIACQQCHGAVQDLELATRDQLPRMRGCFSCHAMSDAASRGTAKSACINCHISDPSGASGAIKTMFASGEMLPPRWLHNSEHGPDWIERHKQIAANDSQYCANCHKEDFCVACHDGRVRPRSIHPADYISMHPIDARQASEKCTSCHREQSFCLGCHQRVGVSMSGPTNVRESGRFHPPKSIWSDAPRQPGHHAFEAERNLNACVSCHIERDCVTCHGAQGVGGGFNPHPTGFNSRCATQMRRNPRPCFVCHQPQDAVLAECR